MIKGRYKLMFGDCLERMTELEDASLDMILTDPPYNISRKNNFGSMGRQGIDFGDWDKGFDLYSYIDIVFTLLKNGGTFITFNDWKNLGDISKYAETIGFETKDMLRLEKTNPMPRNVNRRYVTDFECGIWFVKPKSKWIFNKQSLTYERPKFVTSRDKKLHPTQKSVSHMEHLLKIHSDENCIVLDPFMGSGTTGVACMNLNRKFVGIENNREFYNISKSRIKEAKNEIRN